MIRRKDDKADLLVKLYLQSLSSRQTAVEQNCRVHSLSSWV